MTRTARQTGTLEHPCPACDDDTTHRPLYRKWGYQIVRCDACGLGATIVDPDFDPGPLYGRGYFTGEQVDGYANYFESEPVLRSEFRHALAHLRRRGASSGRLFEVGCASGFFLMEAAEHFECAGADVSREAIEFGKERGLDVRAIDPSDDAFGDLRDLDAVVLLDVIEHLAEPRAVLTRAHQCMADGGTVMISTGDFASPLAQLMGSWWRLMTPPQHLFFFTAPSLAKMLDSIGFDVVDCMRPFKLVPIGLAAHQLARSVKLRLPSMGFLDRLGIPVNLFDAMRVVARKRPARGVSSR